jgi:cytochrome P450
VVVNVWCDICPVLFYLTSTFCRGILHDPVTYPEPDAFKPERFINPNGSLREDLVLTSLFGIGRRVCPGRHLADSTVFIVIASLLSVFNIRKSKGTDGWHDMYPITGNAVRCVYRVSLMA